MDYLKYFNMFEEENSNNEEGKTSNVVTGTFKGTTAGTAIDVPLNYSGNGYPIAVLISPKNGLGENNAYYSLVQKNAINCYMATKNYIHTSPIGSSGINSSTSASAVCIYKSTNTETDVYSAKSSIDVGIYQNANANATFSSCVQFKDNKTMSIFIDSSPASSSSYCFPVNIEYTYIVIYSQ